MLERAHFVQQNTECPNISRVTVRNTIVQLWRHVIRSADDRICKSVSLGQILGGTEIAEFSEPILAQKYVSVLQVTVNDAFVVAMLDAEGYLREPGQNLALAEVFGDSQLLIEFYFSLDF